MSNPSFSNIDRWLFELMEGNLSPEQIAQLEAFILQHPELDVDKDMWELAKVDREEVIYPGQDKLYRRRPVGLYMSLGFASIAAVTAIGIYSVMNPFVATQGPMLAESGSNIRVGEFQKGMKFSKREDAKSVSSLKEQSKQTEGNFETRLTYVPQTQGAQPYESQLPLVTEGKVNTQAEVGLISSTENASASTITFEERSSTEIQAIGKSIQPQKAKVIEVAYKPTQVAGRANFATTYNRFGSSGYKESFSSKLTKAGRALQRMMDNPVALKNLKDPHYHVPGMSPIDINFGSVGTLLATRVQSVSRYQWVGQSNEQLINSIGIDGYSYGMRGGIGMQLNHSYYAQGGIQNWNAALSYSPKFSVSRNIMVEPSVRFKMGNKSINPSLIEPGSQVEIERNNVHSFYTSGTGPIGRNLWYRDLGLGLMVNTKWFYAGIQGDNLFRHYDNIYSNDLSDPRRAGKHFVATIGTDYESIKEQFTVSPYLVYQQYENLSEAWLGSNFRYGWLTVGGALSSNMEYAASLGLKFDHFMITYNADMTKSVMTNSMQLSHQLTVRFLTKPSRVGQRLLNQ